MESNEASVQYNRWNEDNMNIQVHSQSRLIGHYNRLCTGRLGIVMKAAASLTMMVAIYIVGYITGYYVHRC
ncbi:small integral membrane protein 1 [Cyprinus carpio]|uniref:Small integral membrane protein 1 n=1 Tax=Cyprinus carpio TaxID=7962 RepID=A0A9Q9ZC42_CYPCA|nr:small integral membrane protein 1 [Cyprinus carpio]XP_018925958.2 small integral membrane protein 1 [Cyprinus carpio]